MNILLLCCATLTPILLTTTNGYPLAVGSSHPKSTKDVSDHQTSPGSQVWRTLNTAPHHHQLVARAQGVVSDLESRAIAPLTPAPPSPPSPARAAAAVAEPDAKTPFSKRHSFSGTTRSRSSSSSSDMNFGSQIDVDRWLEKLRAGAAYCRIHAAAEECHSLFLLRFRPKAPATQSHWALFLEPHAEPGERRPPGTLYQLADHGHGNNDFKPFEKSNYKPPDHVWKEGSRYLYSIPKSDWKDWYSHFKDGFAEHHAGSSSINCQDWAMEMAEIAVGDGSVDFANVPAQSL